MESPTARTAGGFSLIEVLCAVVILGFGLVAVLECITVSLAASRDAEEYSTAALLAAGRLETLRAEGYLSSGEEEGVFEDAHAAFRWRQEIETTSLDGLFAVTVTIERAASSVPVFTIETLLFEVPFDSPLEGLDAREAGRRERELRERTPASRAGEGTVR